ncbi:MAG: LemA family protein [Clostridia bacterium]|nr:LemA family protein [Clostridia bacterium]
MKKGLVVIIIVALVLVLLVSAGVGTYNGFVEKQETIRSKESIVQTDLQRRADLIPNLVNTVKGYAQHEENVLTEVTNARAAVERAGTFEEQMAANDQLSSALSRLMVVVEAYPELKADKNFVALQDELAGTENRIAVSRKDYNEAVKEYNTAIRRFPASIIAGICGFEKSDEYFAATDSAQSAPVVSF